MRLIYFLQCYKSTVKIPDDVALTEDAVTDYMEDNDCWPNITDAEFCGISGIQEVET